MHIKTANSTAVISYIHRTVQVQQQLMFTAVSYCNNKIYKYSITLYEKLVLKYIPNCRRRKQNSTINN